MNPTTLKLLTVGNPNCGKTSLFNALTGSRQHVGNWPGVTVDKKAGYYQQATEKDDLTVEVTDLPGFYSLEYLENQSSLDQLIAVQAILNQDEPMLILNVVDATNLERHLYLTVQLRELQRPMVVIINKIDLLEEQHQSLDIEALKEALGCPVYALSAHSKVQVNDLKEWLYQHHQKGIELSKFKLDYASPIEEALSNLLQLDKESDLKNRTDNESARRHQLLNFLSSDIDSLDHSSREQTASIKSDLSKLIDIDISIADTRYTFLYNLCQRVRIHAESRTIKLTKQIDNILLHPFFGIPLFLLIMYLMFMFAINLGGAFIDFFDISVGALLVDGGHYIFDPIFPAWLVTILADGIGAGIQTVTTFIPVIFFLYLFMSILESTGYMARAAFILDKLMQKIGLPGKAFVPLIIGFGCNVPSVMATRTLDQENERRLAAAMVPFMSCGARLPVYALFCTAFFPNHAQNIVFALYLLGILVALFTGFVLSRTIFPVNSNGMIIEMPNYESPTLKYLWFKTYHKLNRFIFGAGKTIVIAITILSFLNSLGTDGSFGNQDTEKSVLTVVAKKVTPLLQPMGVTENNWPATVGIITGLFAKEAVIGTLNSLYNQNNSSSSSQESYDLIGRLKEALWSIPNNLTTLNFSDPLNMSVDIDTEDLTGVAESQGVDQSIFGNIQATFVSASAAVAYLIFILLYTPCVAAISAYSKEFGRSFMIFIASWTMFMAYGCSVLFYQANHFNTHPTKSMLYIFAIIILTLMVIQWLKHNKYRFAPTENSLLNTQNKGCC